jgi:hypothetical protein
MGQIAELTRRQSLLFREAQERGDLYAMMNLGTYIMAIARVGQDSPAEGRQELLEITSRWSQRGFHVQHHNVLLARSMIDLYEGQGQAAWDYISERWSFYRTSLLRMVQQVRIDVVQLRARAALAVAAISTDPEPFLQIAERQARRLEREKALWAVGHVYFIQAAISAARGRDDRAAELLTRAYASQ